MQLEVSFEQLLYFLIKKKVLQLSKNKIIYLTLLDDKLV